MVKRVGYVLWWASWIPLAVSVPFVIDILNKDGSLRPDTTFALIMAASIVAVGRALKYILAGE